MDAERLLKDVPLFEGFEPRYLAVLAKMVHERSFAPGEVIFHEGDQGVAMYIVATGEVEVYHERGGKEERFLTVGPGGVFGEISVLVGHPRIAAVRALQPTECLVLTDWNFRAVLDESPEIAKHLLYRLAQWIVDAEDRAAARVAARV
jgi:CRP/FNR family transcriptional regulator, cyclic AMP receptor protein